MSSPRDGSGGAATALDRTPGNHSPEAEQSVIGALLLDSRSVWAAQGLEAGHFYQVPHQTIWRAATALIAAKKPVDVITVFEALQSRGLADEVGGLAYLNDLAASVPGVANMGRYAESVRRWAQHRAVVAAADRALDLARRSAADPDAALDQAAALFAGLRQRGQRGEPESLGDLMLQASQHWQALADGTATPGVSVGLPPLDRALNGGMRGGSLYVLAARPSIGKTSLAGQIALHFARQRHSVLFLSQEMSGRDLANRAAANMARVNLGTLIGGGAEPGDDQMWGRLTEAVEAAMHLPFKVDAQPALTIHAINAKARSHAQQHGLGLLVLDYLQLTEGTDGRANRNAQIEEVSRGLKALAKDLDVPVLALAQLNRASTHRDEPTLADLKDSGAIEQDADVVLMLHPKGDLPDGSMLIAGILAKNRQGRRGRVALAFEGSTQRWTESHADVSSKAGQ